MEERHMNGKRKTTIPAAAAFALLLAMLVAQIADATHPRPKGATPLRVPLVPAYKQCTGAGNRTHGAPLAFPSCNPPVQESSSLTVGTPDANGAAANSLAFVQFKVIPANFDGELRVSGSVSDVRCRPGTDASVCNSPNTADGPDYSGEVEINSTIRITDHYNGPGLNEAATVQDIPFPIRMFCTNTVDTSTGAVCSFTQSCPLPEGCSIAGRRTVVEIGQVRVDDGGPDGLVGTADNAVFLRQGIFIP
jgi:hypothetical protein